MIPGANAVVSVYNMVYGAKTNTYPIMPNLSGVEAYIESQQADIAQVLGEQNNIETLQMFCDPITVSTGDKVIDDKGREYRVDGVERHENNFDGDDLMKITLKSPHSITH